MDIVVIVNDNDVIVIEDKVHSNDHGNQLDRYRKIIEEDYSLENIHLVYLKTGDQSRYFNAKSAGYHLIKRKDLLNVLNKGVESGIKNEIFIDFSIYLNDIRNSVQSYKKLSLDKWHWDSWKGFYQDLQDMLNKGEWAYVPQKNGGFLGFWWHWKLGTYEGIEFQYYLQLEHGKMCFKIIVEGDSEARYKIRDMYRRSLYPKAKELNVPLRQNGRIGRSMTVAALSQGYRQINSDGSIDMDATAEYLKSLQDLLNSISFE